MDRVQFIGNLGSDPEMRYVNDSVVTNFSVAVNKNYTRQNGERVEETKWYRVSCWGRQAETVNQYLSKGSKVFVEGEVEASHYTTDQGEVRTSLDVRANPYRGVEFLDPASRNGGGGVGGGQTAPPINEEEDDLPW